MRDAPLLPPDALRGVNVGLSVSDSADLGRLGLHLRHADQAIAEIARAVLIAGGELTYGGWLMPESFTALLMKEVYAYGGGDTRLTLCVAYPEHRTLDLPTLARIRDELSGLADLVFLDPTGASVDPWAREDESPTEVTEIEVLQESYTALRTVMARGTSARVVVGGQLSGFKGRMPGLVEEAFTSVRAGQPLYVAGGFGGAAAAIARTLGIDSMDWLPDTIPEHIDDPEVTDALSQLAQAASDTEWTADDGLSEEDRRALSASHRPGEIASIVAVGMSQHFG